MFWLVYLYEIIVVTAIKYGKNMRMCWRICWNLIVDLGSLKSFSKETNLTADIGICHICISIMESSESLLYGERID